MLLYRQPWALNFQAEQGARMKHQTITAALIPESYAVIWSQYLTEYRINKRVSTDMTRIKHILTCTFKIMAVVKVLICFGINHCFYWNVIWMLCNWPRNHSSRYELSFQCGRVWVFESVVCWTHGFLSKIESYIPYISGTMFKAWRAATWMMGLLSELQVAPGKQDWFS